MAEKNKDERTTARSAVENALVKALSDDMGEIPEVSITVEELKALDAADKKKRRKRAARCASVAAVAVIVCAAVVYMAWPETVVPVDADKNTEQRVETGDGVVIINEGEAEGEGIVTYSEKSWKNVKKLRKIFKKLAIPEYVPEGYNFVDLSIEQYSEIGGFKATYKYWKSGENLLIEQRQYEGSGENAPILTGKERELHVKQNTVYILDDEDNSSTMATLYTNQTSIKVIGNLSDDDIIKLIEEIDMP